MGKEIPILKPGFPKRGGRVKDKSESFSVSGVSGGKRIDFSICGSNRFAGSETRSRSRDPIPSRPARAPRLGIENSKLQVPTGRGPPRASEPCEWGGLLPLLLVKCRLPSWPRSGATSCSPPPWPPSSASPFSTSPGKPGRLPSTATSRAGFRPTTTQTLTVRLDFDWRKWRCPDCPEPEYCCGYGNFTPPCRTLADRLSPLAVVS